MGSSLNKRKKSQKSDTKKYESAILNKENGKNSFDKLLDLITDSSETRMENRKENFTNSPLYILPDLVLINIVNMLSIPDHMNFSKSCHRFHEVCKPSILRLKGKDFKEDGPRSDESFQPEIYFEGPKLQRGVNAMKMALRWKDQGWGNRKGELYVQLVRNAPEDQLRGAYNLKSSGEAAHKYPQLMGIYKKTSETFNNFPVYKQVDGKGMAYVDSKLTWVVGKQTYPHTALLSSMRIIPKSVSSIKPPGHHSPETPPFTSWTYWENMKWVMDETLMMDPVDAAVIAEYRKPLGNAHHEMTRAECDLSEHDVVKKARSGDHFRFIKNVGGGGGHSLTVEDFRVIVKLNN